MADEKDDIFKEAARQSLEGIPMSSAEIEKELKEAESGLQSATHMSDAMAMAMEHTIKGDKWDNLAEYVSGDGAQRLLDELKVMNARDFVRNYLKLLEHFKPKLVRSDSSPNDDIDRTIQVELVQQLPDGEMRIININQTEKTRNE